MVEYSGWTSCFPLSVMSRSSSTLRLVVPSLKKNGAFISFQNFVDSIFSIEQPSETLLTTENIVAAWKDKCDRLEETYTRVELKREANAPACAAIWDVYQPFLQEVEQAARAMQLKEPNMYCIKWPDLSTESGCNSFAGPIRNTQTV